MAEFARFVAQHREGQFDDQDYVALHDWSVNNLEDFWAELWAYFEVVTHRPYSRVKPSASADDIKWGRGWFEGATLNYAENALRHGDDGAVAVIAEAEDGSRAELTWAELRERVGSVAEWLRAVGCRLPRERPARGHRIPGQCGGRRGVVLLRARLRGAGGVEPIRPARTSRPLRYRRLSLERVDL
jgi:hypothetical protein